MSSPVLRDIAEERGVDIPGRYRKAFRRPPKDEEKVSDFDDFIEWFSNNKAVVPKIVFTLICLSVALTQSIAMIEIYRSYPMGVNVYVKQPLVMKEALPGITVCDRNRIELKKMKPLMEKAGVTLDETSRLKKFWGMRTFINASLNDQTTRIDKFYDLAPSVDEFVKYLKCDGTSWSSNSSYLYKDCESIPVIQHLQYSGMCFSFFHEAAATSTDFGIKRVKTYEKSPKRNLETLEVKDVKDTLAQEGVSSAHEFAPNEIVQIMVDFRPKEQTNTYKQIGGKVYIHDKKHLPGLQEMYFDIEPGYYYEYYIRRVTTEQLPHPYPSNCTNYGDNLKYVRGNKTFETPLTQEECIRLCMTNASISKCAGVYPPDVPYFRPNGYPTDFAIKMDIDDIKLWSLDRCKAEPTICVVKKYLGEDYPFRKTILHWGGWRREFNRSTSQMDVCYSEYYTECRGGCNVDCEKDNYEIVTAKTEWPFIEVTEAATPEEKEKSKQLRKCCAYVSIRYSTTVKTVRTFSARYDNVTTFLSSVGGLVGMYTGISIFGIYEMLEYLVSKLANVKF